MKFVGRDDPLEGRCRSGVLETHRIAPGVLEVPHPDGGSLILHSGTDPVAAVATAAAAAGCLEAFNAALWCEDGVPHVVEDRRG